MELSPAERQRLLAEAKAIREKFSGLQGESPEIKREKLTLKNRYGEIEHILDSQHPKRQEAPMNSKQGQWRGMQEAEPPPKSSEVTAQKTELAPAREALRQLPSERIQCPYCAEEIMSDAKKCRFCGEWLTETVKGKNLERPLRKDRRQVPTPKPDTSGSAVHPDLSVASLTRRDKKLCPKCKEWIDSSATKCPHCRSDQTPPWAVLVAVLLFLGLIIWGYRSCSSIFSISPESKVRQEAERLREERYGSKTMAYIMSQEFVRQRLKSPGSAKFPWYDDSYVSDLGQGRYRIKAHVDSENVFGATLRTQYTCILKYVGNEEWTLESINLE